MPDIDWSECPIVETDPLKMSGIPTLRGWRLSADSVLQNYDYGATAQDISEWFHVPVADIEALLAYAETARNPVHAHSVR